MSVYVQAVSNQKLAIKACGRACTDMGPSNLPAIPVPPPVSLATILREHPGMVLEPEWLEAMDTSPTVH
ncbi:MAG TPA: hypothetical protein DIC36_09820 [Gammaproteobacteria bacterium]|nr:hypothetical protein [Gammaproteobacteria bacterium]